MPPFAMAAEKENFILDILGRVIIQLLHLMVEALPLGILRMLLELGVRRVGAVDEAKVDCGL